MSTNANNLFASDKVYYLKLFKWGVFLIYIIAPALSIVVSHILSIRYTITPSLYFILILSYQDVVLPSFYVLVGAAILLLINVIKRERTKPFSSEFPGRDIIVTIPGWISLWALIIGTYTLLRAFALPFYTENQAIISQVTSAPGAIMLLANMAIHTVMIVLSYKAWLIFRKS